MTSRAALLVALLVTGATVAGVRATHAGPWREPATADGGDLAPWPGVERLTGVWMPAPIHLPFFETDGATWHYMWRELGTPRGRRFVDGLLPSQSGVLWASLLATVLLLGGGLGWRDLRWLDLLLLQAVGWTLYGCMWFFGRLHVAAYATLMDWTFTANVVVTLALLARAAASTLGPSRAPWPVAVPARAAAVVACLVVTGNLAVIAIRAPDDSTWFVNLGAQRLRERDALPYGDPMLTGTPGAAYGPVLYGLQAGVQAALLPRLNTDSPDAVDPKGTPYWLPPAAAARWLLALAHLVGAWALWRLVARDAGSRAHAWAAVAVYGASALVMGVGGGSGEDQVCGLSFVSHVVPPAFVLLALLNTSRPAWSGAWLACAGGAGFYPLLMAPAWLAHMAPDRRRALRFLAGFGLVAMAVGTWVLVASRPAPGFGLVQTIVRDTLGHHTDPAGYGSSPFGFWGQREGVRAWWRTPLVAGAGWSNPLLLGWVVVALAVALPAYGNSRRRLALLASIVAAAASLSKIHATGTYGMWWLSLLLYGLVAGDPGPDRDVEPVDGAPLPQGPP